MTPSLVALLEGLPEPVRERIRVLKDARPGEGGFVLYWMRTAARGHENPALDAAIEAANALGRPAFVYHALSERYPYASDRHHTFVLEGARDAAQEVRARGVGYAFHLERPGARGPFLRELAGAAALVVTEEMPVAPLVDWTRSLASALKVPLLSVDTACVAPLPLVGRAYDRPHAFREAVGALQSERLERAWREAVPQGSPFVPELPCPPVELEEARLHELVAVCAIDHGVPPVPETPGGARAGYARWEAFRAEGLADYARDRNDPRKDGVSRMSAYLHYGHVSPLRIAREARAAGGEGAERFRDELLLWRELAYAFCRYRPDHDTLWAVPPWARESLRRHEADPRKGLPTWEQLARARSGDPFWDAAQRSLLRHGELHNNLRMTWGKALLGFTRSADEALSLLVDLNHRYALDGRDPASYGGILWCLGQFDRPFRPESAVFGQVRPRRTTDHARRLDVRSYAERLSSRRSGEAWRVAVVGGGIAGLACARTLQDQGVQVRVFETGEAPGGRAAACRIEGRIFDGGAQYFTVRDDRFRRYVESWRELGLVSEWRGRIGSLEEGAFRPQEAAPVRYVGVPTMGRLAAHLAEDLDLLGGVRVVGLEREGRGWTLRTDRGESGGWEAVVIALPAPAAAGMLEAAPALARRAAAVRFRPCWELLLDFAGELALPFDGAFVMKSPLRWVARDSGKPGRPLGERWVLHASPEWSEEHLEDDAEAAAVVLRGAFARATGREDRALFEVARRWRFALPDSDLGVGSLLDAEGMIVACGDWCLAPRIEGAFLSGVAAAGRLLGLARSHPDRRP
jgi:photolyase PhrII